jgi:hypothetical protein
MLWLWGFFLVVFCCAGNQIQGLANARQASTPELHPLQHTVFKKFHIYRVELSFPLTFATVKWTGNLEDKEVITKFSLCQKLQIV